MVGSLRTLLALGLAALWWPSGAGAQSSPSAYTSAARYDVAGRVVGTIAPDPDGGGPLHYAAVRTSYDTAGRVVLVEKGELASWQDETVAPSSWSGFTVFSQVATAYDALDHKVTETVSSVSGGAATAQTVTQYSYDAVGRLSCTAVRMNAAGFGSLPDACTLGTQGSQGADRITHNVYDPAGQVLKVQKAYGTPLQQDYATYTYTANGKQASVADANGNLAAMTFDGFDRLVQWTFPSKTAVGQVNASDYEAYGYDAAGNRTSLRKRDGTTLTYGYDALNRMVSKAVPTSATGAAGYTVSYGYDLRNLQTSALFATGQGITSSYDGFGELTTSTSTMGGISRTVSAQYDADGDQTQLTHPDGTYFTLGYDGLDRLASGSWWTGATGTVPFLGLAYAPQSWRTTIAHASSQTNYGYDPIGRLTGQGQAFAGGAGNLNETLGYNPASQIVSETRDNDAYAWTGAVNVNRAYAVNGLNQYTSAGPATFGYDANGNLTSDGTTSYVYDAENRLVSASSGATLAYDPMGRLWQVTGAGGTRQLLYDGDELAVEYAGSGAVSRRYMFAGEDEPVLEDAGGAMNCSQTRFLHTDHQGSIVAAADCYGNRQSINAYDEYGIPGPNNTGRFGYTGQAWLPELGMWYYKARIYSPTLGRFLQTDPIGYKDQMDLYAYVGNDPVNGRDPSGKQIVQGIVWGARGGCVADIETGCVPGAVLGAIGGLAVGACIEFCGHIIHHDEASEPPQDSRSDAEKSRDGQNVITGGTAPTGKEGVDNRGKGRNVSDVIDEAAAAAGTKSGKAKDGNPTVVFPDGSRAIGYPSSTTTGGPSITITTPKGRVKVKTREDHFVKLPF